MNGMRWIVVAVLVVEPIGAGAQSFYSCKTQGQATVIQETPCLTGKETQLRGERTTGKDRTLEIVGGMLDSSLRDDEARAYALSHGITEPEFASFAAQRHAQN